ncbi:hypothetical protein [Chitinophaga sp.]|uniref:hypothetical protein n=1 Tax=Chitinophaga sp. TaxID=1869181 RepID=UPI0031D682D7
MKLLFPYLCLLAVSVQAQTRVIEDSSRSVIIPIYNNKQISGYAKMSVKNRISHYDLMDDQWHPLLTIEIDGPALFGVDAAQNGEQICLTYHDRMGFTIGFYKVGQSTPVREYKQDRCGGFHQVISVPGKGFACLNGTQLEWFNVNGDSVTTVDFLYRPLNRDSRLDIDMITYNGDVYFLQDELIRFNPETASLHKQAIPKTDVRGHLLNLWGMALDPVTGRPYISAGIYNSAGGPPPLRHAETTSIITDLRNCYEGICTMEIDNGLKSHFTYWNLGTDTFFYPMVLRRDFKRQTMLVGLNIVKNEKMYNFGDPVVLTIDSTDAIVRRDYVEMAHRKTDGRTEMWRFVYQELKSFWKDGELYLWTDDQEKERLYSVSERKVVDVADKHPDICREVWFSKGGNVLIIADDKRRNIRQYTMHPIDTRIP